MDAKKVKTMCERGLDSVDLAYLSASRTGNDPSAVTLTYIANALGCLLHAIEGLCEDGDDRKEI